MRKTPSRSRKAIYTIIVTTIVLLIVEVSAQLTFRALYGHSYRPKKLYQFTRSSWIPGHDNTRNPSYLRGLVIHPYIGFINDVPAGVSAGLGFAERISPSESRRFQDQLRILVLGGSVAAQIMSASQADGTGYLKRALRNELENKGIELDVWTFNGAIQGAKQPQQLMIYSFLLAQDAEFDLVVNLDGFNEMTLAFEGKRRSLHPVYPRSWDLMVGGRLTAGNLRRLAGLLQLREQQESLIEFAQSTPLARSALVGLFFTHRLTKNDRRVRALAEETEHKKIQGELTLEQGGIPFDFEDNEGTYRYLVRLWSRSSRILSGLAANHDTEYLHVFQPNQYAPGSKQLTPQEREKYYFPDAGLGLYYGKIYPYFREEIDTLLDSGEWFIDATMIYKDESETVYADSCCHFNHRGRERLAAFIAREIVAGSDTVQRKAKSR